jgi:hypothetical protein
MSANPPAGDNAGPLALCGALVLAVAAAAALPAGQGAAAALVGGGWVWPPQEQVLSSIGGLLAGSPARGLPPGDAAAVPAAAAVYSAVGVLEVLLIAAAVLALVVALRMRPHRGLATRVQAQQEFGAGALRRRRRQIRPDLYGDRRGVRR